MAAEEGSVLGNTTSIDTPVNDADGAARTILRHRRARRLFGRRAPDGESVPPILPADPARPGSDIDDWPTPPANSEVPVTVHTTIRVTAAGQAHGDDGPIAAEDTSSRWAASRPPVSGWAGPATLPASLAQRFPPVPRAASVPLPAPPPPVLPPYEPRSPDSLLPEAFDEPLLPLPDAREEPPPPPRNGDHAEMVLLRDEFTHATTTFQTLFAAHQVEMSLLVTELSALRAVMTTMQMTTKLPDHAAGRSAAEQPPVAAQPLAAAAAIVGDVPRQRATRGVTLEVDAAAAIAAAAARIGLPPPHVDVLQQWVAHDGRAVIEVAHAGGRHRIGLAAIVYAVSTGRQVLVVVPNRESADSWRASLAVHAPEIDVLVDGGRQRDPAATSPQVVLSTAATTARRITAGFEPTALLVAIDAERFSTALLAKSLDERCEWRLGLSESFRSGSRRLARYADDYFGGTVLTIS